MQSRICFLAVIAIAAAPAQRFTSSSWDVKPDHVTILFGPPRPGPVVTNAPYSADEVMDYTRTLPDGTSDTRTSVVGHYARDAQGRTRMERAYKPAPIWLAEIFDPVQAVAYLLDDQNRIAHRMALPAAAAEAPPAPRGTTEMLGTRLIEGVETVGTRLTSGPLRIEKWDEPDLNVTVLTISSNGYTTRLANLTRAEPDPSRFQPPPGYTVVDEPGKFTMTVKFPPE